MRGPSPIRVLDEATSSRIAAGEVIERPASVVKELLENSLDAGADDVRIEIREGGRRLIRVGDNGHGIPSDQVELAFEPHATSKIETFEELERVTTLGFRGEALTSIAAVCRVTLDTRAASEETGTRIRLEMGRVVLHEPTGAPVGTTISAENLFHAVPARLQFLRSESTESAHVTAVVTRYALAYPDRRFQLLRDGKSVFRSDGSGHRSTLGAVFGPDVAREMLKVGTPIEAGVRVTGFVSPPSVHRATRRQIVVFVNGRWVQDSSLTYAIVQAYHALLPHGRFPLAAIKVTVPPKSVDINVHPAKAEVRFREPRAVFSAVERSVRRAVIGGAPVPAMGIAERPSPPWAPTAEQRRIVAIDHDEEGRERHSATGDTGALPILRVLGQLGRAYIVAEGPDGMYLVDQHAAHERVMYEQLKANRGAPASQKLLKPTQVPVRPDEMAQLEESSEAFAALGFEIEPFGADAALVRALPEGIPATDVQSLVTSVLETALSGGDLIADTFEERLVRAVCKQATVKAGQTLTTAEMGELIRSLEATNSPRTCPHGRPTVTVLSLHQLAGGFGKH